MQAIQALLKVKVLVILLVLFQAIAILLQCVIQKKVPLYAEEGKSALVIAIGCTGGHHRSVAVAHELAEYITEEGYQVTENHRDISR